MSLLSNWQQEYGRLTAFVAAHPQIGIEKNSVSIPADVREEFYELFDAVGKAFVEDKVSTLPQDIEILCSAYQEVERELKELLRLDSISMSSGLDTFLHHPREGLVRILFDRLFDLLQGKIEAGTFDPVAASDLAARSAELCRWGYETWVTLALVQLLEPHQGFQVLLDSEDKPVLDRLNKISIGYQFAHPTLRLPEFIVHSHRAGQYVALKAELAAEIPNYVTTSRPEKRQSMQRGGDTSSALGHRALLVYVAKDPGDIPIIADLEMLRVSPPDIVVECLDGDDMVLGKPNCYHDILQPKKGTYTILRESEPSIKLPAGSSNIYPVVVGFDPRKLQPIVDLLI